MNKFFILLSILVLFCCSPKQRLNRLLKKHPELIRTQDTIITDTIITRSFYYDSTLKANFFRDTIIIVKNNLTTKVHYNYNTDSLYIHNDLLPDTIIKTIIIPGKTIEVNKKENGLFYWFLICVMILLLIGLIKAIRK
jgi:hypothetical protein